MNKRIILASASHIRAELLANAGVRVAVCPAAINEQAIRETMQEKPAPASEIALALACEKAKKIAQKHPSAMVIGCDQLAVCGQNILAKPVDQQDARTQLETLSGQTHFLYSSAAVYNDNTLVWSQTGIVKMQMHVLSDQYIQTYITRNWHSIRHSVGCYKLEEEGARLFSAIKGDYFHVLGLPLIELLSYLTTQGVLQR